MSWNGQTRQVPDATMAAMGTADDPGAVATHALIGWPLAHSLSPAMHNAAFEHARIDARYASHPVAPDDLGAFVGRLKSGELEGANVTVPHKLSVRSMIDAESDIVAATGAVNTIVRTRDGLRGENTDVAGFRHALEEAGAPASGGSRAVVIGAGGSARAVVFTLLGAGWCVTVLNRSSDSLGLLAATMRRAFSSPRLAAAQLDAARLAVAARDADILVNATPIGSSPGLDDSPWPDGTPVPAHLIVIDLVAWPHETHLARQAREGGADFHGGVEMLIWQAASSWSLWTGRPAPVAVMRAAALEAIEAQAAAGNLATQRNRQSNAGKGHGRITPRCHCDS